MIEMNIVTGGTSGLGLAIASELVKAGQNVLVIGRNQDKLDRAVSRLKSMNPLSRVLARAFDISDDQMVQEVYNDLVSDYTIKALINAACIGYFGPAQAMENDQISAMLDANLKGMILMTTHVLKHLENEGGKIINIISTAGLKGKAKESVYCATKWGARGYTEALKAELKGTKVLVYGVYPGGMATDFWKAIEVAENFMKPDEVARSIVKNTLMSDLYISDLIIERH